MTRISDITISLKKEKTYCHAFLKFSQNRDDFEEEFQTQYAEFPEIQKAQRHIQHCEKKIKREEKVLRLLKTPETEHRLRMAKMRIKCYRTSLETEKKQLKEAISKLKADLPEKFLTISSTLCALEFLFPKLCSSYKPLKLALEDLFPK